MAEALARHAAGGRGSLVFASAGTYAGDGNPATVEAVATLDELGVDLRGHASQPLTPALLATADLVLAMTRRHRRIATAMDGTVPVELLDPDGHDVPDPYGYELSTYRQVRDQIHESLSRRLQLWSGQG